MRSNAVALRVFRIALVTSLVFLLLSTAFIYMLEYRQRSSIIESEVEIHYEAQATGIVEALWDYDYDLLRILADGLGFYPYINYVAIEDARGIVAESGSTKDDSASRSYALVRRAPGRDDLVLGTLLIQIDSSRIRSDVVEQILVSVVFQALFLATISLIVFVLFSRMVTRHLARIAAHISEADIHPGAEPLTLDKRNHGDELDILVRSFNEMHRNVQNAHEAQTRAMEELRLSEEKSRVLVEEAPDAILMYDYEGGVFTSCNRQAAILFGRSREELLVMRPVQLYTPVQPDGLSAERSIAETTANAIAGKPVLVRRHVVNPRSGIIICELRVTALPWEGRHILRASYLDITDRVKAEEEVARSLREKEVLLQEVYHRTKNNMQLIASFLSMEASASGDERIISLLNDMIGRISSMALIHQKLYESKDLSRIDIGEYVQNLVQEIRQAYLIDRPGIEIAVKTEDGIVWLLDEAIPCALALNELVVNSVKYAYPRGRGGTIRVELFRGEPGRLRLSVSDDGVGLPPGFDFRRDGKIGIQTVISLIESQLRGRVEFSAGPGTTCVATIQEHLYRARV